jgi:hypothetical protein
LCAQERRAAPESSHRDGEEEGGRETHNDPNPIVTPAATFVLQSISNLLKMKTGTAAIITSVAAEKPLRTYTEIVYDSLLAHAPPSTLGSHWLCTGVHWNVAHRVKASVSAVMMAAVARRVQVVAAEVLLKRSRRDVMESLAKQRVRRYIISAMKKARPQGGRSREGLGRVVMCLPPPWEVWTGTIAAKTVREAWCRRRS